MQAGELFTKELNKIYQVSAPQLHCLLALHENGPLPPSQIARHVMVKSSTVTGIIDRLEQKDLVERLRNSPDRRVITIQLTEAGKELAKNAPFPIQHKIVDGLKKLPEKEIKRIITSLSKLTQMLDVQDLEVE
jgi:DNA-binding MarR family transcriptional regulator